MIAAFEAIEHEVMPPLDLLESHVEVAAQLPPQARIPAIGAEDTADVAKECVDSANVPCS